MTWDVEFLPEAIDDMRALDPFRRARVTKAIEKVRTNPYPVYGDAHGRCGYGKPLGSKAGQNLAGLLKIKLKQDGIRVVYKLEERDGRMLIIIVGMRSDNEVYDLALRRRVKNGI